MSNPSFIVRVVVIFVPLVIFMFLMYLAGITSNIFMTILLSLLFVWMEQAIYKKVLQKKAEKNKK